MNNARRKIPKGSARWNCSRGSMLGFTTETDLFPTIRHATVHPGEHLRFHDSAFLSDVRLGVHIGPRRSLCGAVALDRAPRMVRVRDRHQDALPDGRASAHARGRRAAGNRPSLLATRRPQGGLAIARVVSRPSVGCAACARSVSVVACLRARIGQARIAHERLSAHSASVTEVTPTHCAADYGADARYRGVSRAARLRWLRHRSCAWSSSRRTRAWLPRRPRPWRRSARAA